MFVVSVACDFGVGGIGHEGAFEPLNELALENPQMSAYRVEASHICQMAFLGRCAGARTDLFSSCAGIITTSHLGDPHLWYAIVFRQLNHSPDLLIQHVAVLGYRQLATAVPVHAYGLECILRAVRCRQR